MSLSKQKMLDLYEMMVRIRKFEEQAKDSFADGYVQGFVHLSIGEEAVPTGVCANLNDDDYITSTHRGHGHVLAKKAKTDIMLAELYGRADGYNRGKGGSMHIANRELGILGANGIVGAGQPISCGAALASKIRKDNKVTVCFFGDGASNEGTFHEALNAASAWNLPVVFVCTNNLYGISTRISRSSKNENIADRAVGYGIPGKIADGNDVVAVLEASKEAIDRARNGGGPTLLEFKSYRHRGHFEGDPGLYKPEEEQAEWMAKDPLIVMKNRLLNENIASAEEVQAVEDKITKEIAAAHEFAMKSPFPDPSTVLEDLYTDIIEEGR